MGVFDGVGGLKGLLGQVEAAAAPALVSALLAKTDLGSLQGIVAKLQAAGLDDQVRSWLGNGSNLPVTADQLRWKVPTRWAMLQPHLSLPRCRASEASTFRTSDCEIPNSRAIRGGAIPALKAARTAFTWPRVSERTATCAGRTLEDSFLFRDALCVGSCDALAAGPDGRCGSTSPLVGVNMGTSP